MEKGSACIGFIKKKFVTMQGHMNMIHTSIYIYIYIYMFDSSSSLRGLEL